MTYTISSIADLPEVAKKVIPLLEQFPVVAFYGAMGAGKTTFIKAICDELKVGDTVNSPSFAIINEYLSGNGQPIFHFDFYRLKNITELFDLGYEEYFDGGNICLIEWPEIIEDYLPNERLNIIITEIEDGKRTISISK